MFFQAAVHHVTPQHTQHLPSEGRSSHSSATPVTISDDFINMTASTSKGVRVLTIDVEQNGHSLAPIIMSEMGTLGSI